MMVSGFAHAGRSAERWLFGRRGFGVFAAFSRWLTARSERGTLVAAAIEHFEARGQRAIHGMCRVIGDLARGAVVRVCHGDPRPPHRAWFVVGPLGVVAELSWAEAERLGARPCRLSKPDEPCAAADPACRRAFW
jgi:hypothetical protein